MKKISIGISLFFFINSCLAEDSANFARNLAYLSLSDGYWQVWVADENGNNARQTTYSKSDKARVSWYPDGKTLLVSFSDGHLAKISVDSGEEVPLALEQSPILDASVSPDGKKISYSFSTAIDGNDLWLADFDGQRPERLVQMTGLQHEPIWSADGRVIYFLSGDGKQSHDIWKISPLTHEKEQLTVGELYHFDIAVSSDSRMAYSSNRTGNYEIYLKYPEKPAIQLTNDPALDAHPSFTEDGLHLVFESSRGGAMNLWKINLSDGHLEQITHTRFGARSPVCRRKEGN